MIIAWLLEFYKIIFVAFMSIGALAMILKHVIRTDDTNNIMTTTKTVNVQITDPALIAKIENYEELQDTYVRQILQKKIELKNLQDKMQYTFNQEIYNKLEGKELKIQADIIKLQGKCDDLTWKIDGIARKYYNQGR